HMYVLPILHIFHRQPQKPQDYRPEQKTQGPQIMQQGHQRIREGPDVDPAAHVGRVGVMSDDCCGCEADQHHRPEIEAWMDRVEDSFLYPEMGGLSSKEAQQPEAAQSPPQECYEAADAMYRLGCSGLGLFHGSPSTGTASV